MIKIWTTTILFLLIFSIEGCKKDSEIMDDFKCKVNGKIWKPYSTDLKYGRTLDAHLIDDGKTFFIAAYQENTRQSISFSIFLDANVTIGTYNFNSTKNSADFYDTPNGLKYITQSGNNGTLKIISLDKTNKTVTGEFSFRALDTSTNSSVDITDGQFNIKYKTY